ncbi:MAG: putative phage protein Gp37/Gp68 [Candidatus Eremiobacteraeota bacterium]|nr:putative phage protein Gp37/Gp68 [Candidatus Eremiobacteraeota bacterium]
MSQATKIEWSDETVNIVTGCEGVSPGCDHCYAATWAARGMGQWKGRDFGTVLCHEDRLALLEKGAVGRRKFVCSMADLFHRAVPDAFLERAFLAFCAADRHTFQVLTKRPERMRRFVRAFLDSHGPFYLSGLRNAHLGVSIESNDYAWRADMLRETPAAVRWISAEPLLGPLDRVDLTGISWVVVGGESGAGARPMDLAWAEDVVARCRAAAIPVFVKQLGKVAGKAAGAGNKGGEIAAFPEPLRVREFPMAVAACR